MSLLLQIDEPKPAAVHRAGADAPFLFICDHAGRAVPRVLSDLALPPAAFDRHIAWDIGAAELTRDLADRFEACAILQRYSRLVIDCNRDPGRADAMPEVSDGTPIPGNRALSADERAARVAAIHAPYHAAIAAEMDAREARGLSTVLVCVHSFTPRLAGAREDRPWRFGVLHLGASAISHAMIEVLRQTPGEVVGDNEPYAMDAIDYSAPTHAIARGCDYLELEVRQDLLADPQGCAAVADFLAPRIARAAESARNE